MISNKDKIEKILQENPEGLSITEIAGMVLLSRQTVATILAEFRGAKQLNERMVGQAKLIKWA